ncbi:MAG: hypothetical protein JJ892_10110 [Balneola sp.]|nr:hypothetical protein [Balneola sp.]MBO6649449.1 hypothetical protein [Balneola sp.]MBO6711264.1 hypothetical protein [Balneola sp.]MBO6800621.1 hypothetical protein [Balneola sp.]MBO6869199.1 hypothetical protein [Balneola sp.]
MKTNKYLKLVVLLLVGAVSFQGCADLVVENINDPDTRRALANDEDVLNLLNGGASTVFFGTLLDVRSSHMELQADQITSTNRFFSFWDFSDQPRLRFNNRTTYSDADIFFNPWANLNSAISIANDVLTIAGEGTIEVDGEDVTEKAKANAYFIRGVANSYLGLIYDQAYVVTPESDLANLELEPYTALIAAGVADIELAITTAEGSSNFAFDVLPSGEYNTNQFKSIANSYLARITAGASRTAAEAANTDWDQVLAYANAGLGQSGAADGGAMVNFAPVSVSGVFYNEASDWMNFNVGGAPSDDPSGYLPVDVKVTHMLDASYPTDYPTDANVILDPATSSDPRLDYYVYTTNFGFLNPARRRALFTNYFNVRMYANNNWTASGYPVIFMTKAEVDYLRAEANVMNGGAGLAAAANILNNETPFGSVAQDFAIDLPSVQLGYLTDDGQAGGNTIAPTASLAEFQLALLGEYSVELQEMGGMGLTWFFMRRHNLLQEGSGLHYAVPGQELEITGREYYTYAGEGQDDGGTAQGANSWKNLRSKIVGNNISSKSVIYQSKTAADYPNFYENMVVKPNSSEKKSQ